MKKPIYNAAPLPFMGQKRRFLGEFRKALATFPDARVFVDLFGGSGLLSHTVKQERPDARVIYNDYDGYHLRLANCVTELQNSILNCHKINLFIDTAFNIVFSNDNYLSKRDYIL